MVRVVNMWRKREKGANSLRRNPRSLTTHKGLKANRDENKNLLCIHVRDVTVTTGWTDVPRLDRDVGHVTKWISLRSAVDLNKGM